MDPRIVPDAAPIAAPAAAPVAAPAPAADPVRPEDMTDAQIAALQAQRQTVATQLGEAQRAQLVASLQYTQALLDLVTAQRTANAEARTLLQIQAQFGANSPEYRAQAAVVTQADRAVVRAQGRADGLKDALKTAEDRVADLENQLSLIDCELAYLSSLRDARRAAADADTNAATPV